MCRPKSEGGQRCPSATKPGYLKALEAWESQTLDVTDKHTKAVVEYASTEVGAAEIAKAAKHATKRGNQEKAAWLENSLTRGKVLAAANAEVAARVTAARANMIQKAKVSTVTPSPDGRPTLTLSPTRAADFRNCELAYRYKTIDRFPEPKTEATERGTLVHAVLEKLFDKPPAQRTRATAKAMLPGEWEQMVAEDPEIATLLDENGEEGWLAGANELLDRYFNMEDPRKANPTKREQQIQYKLNDEVTLNGFIDRLDINDDGDMRIIDYKTGKSPKIGYGDKSMFQLKFYALALYRSTGRVPKSLQLMYMGDGQVLRYEPTAEDLEATEAEISNLWTKIAKARETGVFRPKKSGLCNHCNFHDKCPEYGGTIPPMPAQ